jgi:probable HAF family extracellular repeat protein
MNIRNYLMLFLVLSIVLSGNLARAKKPPWQTTIRDLGAFPVDELYYDMSEAHAINDLGQVVGYSYVPYEYVDPLIPWDTFLVYLERAYLWLPQSDYDLPAGLNNLGVLDSTTSLSASNAWGINNLGQVVGQSTAGEYDPARGFCWTPDTGMEMLMFTGNYPAIVYEINDNGLAAGYGSITQVGPVNEAISWQKIDGVWEHFRSGCLRSRYYDINNCAVKAGSMDDWTGQGYVTHAYIWPGSVYLGTLGEFEDVSSAHGLNNNGEVVGSSGAAFYWTEDEGMKALPCYESGRGQGLGTARAINDSSIIVGDSDDRAVMWRKIRNKWCITDLNTLLSPNSGWFLHIAYDINNHNQIVGRGVHNGKVRSYLLTLGRVPDPWQPGDPGGPFGSDESETGFVVDVYPNPFAENTTIKFNLGHSTGITELHVCDATGRLIRQWDDKTIRQSDHVIWDGTDNSGKKVPAGIYFFRLSVGGIGSSIKKIIKLE